MRIKEDEETGRVTIQSNSITVEHFTDTPDILIRNESDATLLGSVSNISLDFQKLDDYIEALTYLKHARSGEVPSTVKDYVAEREDFRTISEDSRLAEPKPPEPKPECPICGGLLNVTPFHGGGEIRSCSKCTFSKQVRG